MLLCRTGETELLLCRTGETELLLCRTGETELLLRFLGGTEQSVRQSHPPSPADGETTAVPGPPTAGRDDKPRPNPLTTGERAGHSWAHAQGSRSRTVSAVTPRGASATRAKLIEATVLVGARAGWGGITTRSVADAAGSPQGLVHYHFGSVDELRRAAVRHAVAVLTEASMAELLNATDVRDAIRAMVEAVSGTGQEERLTIFLYEAFLAARRDDVLRAELAQMLSQWRSDTARWVRTVTSHLANPPEPDATAALLGAAFDGIYIHRMIDPDVDPRVLAEPVARLLGATSKPRPRKSEGDSTR